ncbi:MAG: DUF4097 family beta strand repeat-containing protein [Synoicihabitans sp.]
MKTFLISSVFLFVATASVAAPWNHESVSERSGRLSATASVVIENVNGKVVLQTWDEDSYHVEITKKSRTEENLDLMEVHLESSLDHLSLNVHIPKKKGWFSMSRIQGSVDLVVSVPASVDLEKIRTVNGSVSLAGFSNHIDVSSVNGPIRAQDLGGTAHLNTVNGSIEASFTRVRAAESLEFSSVNGAIRLDFPADLNADLRTSVVNGRIHCDFPLTLTDGSSSRKLRGRIGEGGLDLSASTVNGSIHVRELP